MGPVDILCVNTATKTDINTVIQCPITGTCSHEAIVKERENDKLKSVKIDFNNLDQKYSCGSSGMTALIWYSSGGSGSNFVSLFRMSYLHIYCKPMINSCNFF